MCQKYLATPKILAWCAELARETRKDWQDDTSYNKYFLAPLENLYADTDYPSELREFAEFAHHEVLEKDRTSGPVLSTATYGSAMYFLSEA